MCQSQSKRVQQLLLALQAQTPAKKGRLFEAVGRFWLGKYPEGRSRRYLCRHSRDSVEGSIEGEHWFRYGLFAVEGTIESNHTAMGWIGEADAGGGDVFATDGLYPSNNRGRRRRG
jgi:hypothetical protein